MYIYKYNHIYLYEYRGHALLASLGVLAANLLQLPLPLLQMLQQLLGPGWESFFKTQRLADVSGTKNETIRGRDWYKNATVRGRLVRRQPPPSYLFISSRCSSNFAGLVGRVEGYGIWGVRLSWSWGSGGSNPPQ